MHKQALFGMAVFVAPVSSKKVGVNEAGTGTTLADLDRDGNRDSTSKLA